jgi:uncharacterized integral membrane protein
LSRAILVVALICVVVLAVFAVQNTAPVNIQFFGLTVIGAPLYATVVVTAALVAIVAGLVAAGSRVRLGLRARPVKRQLKVQEKTVGDLTAKVSALQAERDQLAGRVDQLAAGEGALQSKIAELEAKLKETAAPAAWVETALNPPAPSPAPEIATEPSADASPKEQDRRWWSPR